MSVITRSSDNSGSHFATGSVKCEPALVEKRHRRGDGDRLAHRGDAEHGVALHRQTGLEVAVAELVDLQYLAGLPDHRDRPGKQARIDRLTDGRVVAVEIHRRQRTQVATEGIR